ncbi:hypothetical protein CYMTET_38529 [Cymbomonas tetramitiformis]|uniref:Uncharacterized protein n=1 Tax=Cymbomonas tetramitiformis TaxID=36881 RepID=A0AAE0CE32_9CHLO|nr:hypothetical protein CYMTET_38529 [Cymbomonas tetramitiformis]
MNKRGLSVLRPCLFLVACLQATQSAAKNFSTIPLNEWPMIMCHDAATTYLNKSLLSAEVYDWTITQPEKVGVEGLLSCGARGFDWRPLLTDSELYMHHGSIPVKYPMALAVREMVEWSNANPNPEDLVVLGVTACSGDGCADAAKKVLKDAGVSFINDCSVLKDFTVADALQKGQLQGGGHLLATFDCWQGNYVPANTCSGYDTSKERSLMDGKSTFPCIPADVDPAAPFAELMPSQRHELFECSRALRQRTEGAQSAHFFGSARSLLSSSPQTQAEGIPKPYTCYTDSSTKELPVNRMMAYLQKVADEGPPADGRLYTYQALWQEDASSVVLGILHGSSLLEDEERSGLNSLVTAQVLRGSYPSINFMEVNNVCDGGLDLLAALRSRL